MAEPLFTDRALQEAYRALMKDGAAGGHLDEAAWDRIVSGEIDSSARDAAFDHVVECAACSRVWRGILALKSEAETQGLIAADAPSSTPIWRSRWVSLAIAATLVVAVSAIVMRTNRPRPTPQTPPAPATSAAPPSGPAFLAAFPITKADIHITPEEALAPRGTAVSIGEPPIERLATAIEPYRRDDFVEAANRLGTLAKEFPAAGRPALYWGVSLLHLDRASEAVAPLRAATASAQAAVAADARWYYAVALARSNQPAAAFTEVRALCAAGGLRAAAACEAQKALEIAQR